MSLGFVAGLFGTFASAPQAIKIIRTRQARDVSLARKGIGAIALHLARSLVISRSGPTGASHARPWMLSAGWVLVRALRASPTARWVTAAVALGGAAWWVARSLRTGDAPEDESG